MGRYDSEIKGSLAQEALYLFLVIVVGLFFRLYAFHFDPVINPDGTLYVQQAKALYYRKFGLVTACYPYLSIYPIFICLSQSIVHDWVLAGVVVSLFFSLMTVIPLFYLLRYFVGNREAFLASLLFCVMPAFVVHSHHVIRGPIFWFFSVTGLYLFVRYLYHNRLYYPCLSCLCFLIALWARVEAALFVVGSFLWLVFSMREKRLKAVISFVVPLIVSLAVLMAYCGIENIRILKIVPFHAFVVRAEGAVRNYHALADQLKLVGASEMAGNNYYFFGIVRKLLWWVALGAVIRQILRSIFIPFFIILLVGVYGAKGRIRNNPGLAYLTFLSAGAFFVLFVQTLFNWAIHSRHIAIFLFPSFVFFGLGVEKLLEWLGSILSWERKYLVAALTILVLAAPLKKNLSTSRGSDKLVYREIGRFIGHLEGYKRKVTVGGAFKRINLIHFYANENYAGVVCFPEKARLRGKTVSRESILKSGFDYFVWDEKNCRKIPLKGLLTAPFVELGRWKAKKRGQMILFKLRVD